jgi:hypothetical protein
VAPLASTARPYAKSPSLDDWNCPLSLDFFHTRFPAGSYFNVRKSQSLDDVSAQPLPAA